MGDVVSTIWFILMVLFVVLWRQAEKKSEQNFKSYDELRERIINLAKGKKSVPTKDITQIIHDVQYGSQPTQVQEQQASEYVEYTDEPLPEQQSQVDVRQREPYVDTVVDSYGVEPTEKIDQEKVVAVQAQAVAAPAVIEQPLPRQLTAKEIAANKERATLRNLNIMLYMASFLLVAAAAAFVAAAMPELVRLIGLVVVVVMFYVAGIVLYKQAPRFKPAAIAFVGTGLAILPFIGIALTLLGGINSSSAWFITSIVGVAAYVYAGSVLQSQAVSYLSMAFVLSTVSAAVNVASLPIVWYFISLISVSLVASTISFYKPHLLPDVFKKPVESTGQIVTPVALVASVFAAQSMSLQMYELLFVVSTAHYGVVYLQRRALFYETVLRVITHFTLLIFAWDFTKMAGNDNTVFGLWWMALVVAQVAYSTLRIRKAKQEKQISVERIWLVISHCALVLSLLFWPPNGMQQLYLTINLLLLGGTAFVSAMATRQVVWGYISLTVSVITPFTFGRGYMDPALSYTVILFAFAVVSAAFIAAYTILRDKRSSSVMRFLVVAIYTYIAAVIVCGILEGSSLVYGISMIIAGGLLGAVSYAQRRVGIEYVGALMLAYGTGVVAAEYVPEKDWSYYAAAVAMTLVLAILSVAHHYVDKSIKRRDGLAALALLVYGVYSLFASSLNELVHVLSFLLLIAILVSLIGLRWLVGRDEKSVIRTIVTAGYVSFLLIGWFNVFDIAPIWSVVFYVVATGVLWLSSRIERLPGVLVVGNIATVLGCLSLWRWLKLDPEWESLCVGIIAAGIFYLMYALYITYKDIERQWIMSMSAWAALIGAMFFGYGITVGHQVVSICVLFASVGILLTHKYIGHQSKQDRTRLTTVIAVASATYLLLALGYIARDTQLASWSMAVAGIVAVWLSYRIAKRWAEVIGAVELIAAIGLAVSLFDIGDWRHTVTIVVALTGLLVGASIHHLRNEKLRRNGLAAVAIAVFSVLSLNINLVDSGIAQLSYGVLLVGSLIVIGARWSLRQKLQSKETRGIFVTGYIVAAILAWIMSLNLGQGQVVLSAAVASIVFWLASHLEKSRGLLVVGYIFVFVTMMNAWSWLRLDGDWAVIGTIWLSSLMYYAGYWVYVKNGDIWRSSASLIATVLSLVGIPFVTVYLSADTSIAFAGYLSIAIGSMFVVVHGLMNKMHNLTELAVYVATFALQKGFSILVPDVEFVWYAHWWSITIAAVAMWRSTHKTVRFSISMGIISTTVGLLALGQGGTYQLLFLIEHILLLVAGALLRKQWAVWWGIVASVVAILYFIKDYTYLWLGLLGLALIALVVWRLNKLSKSQKGQ